MDALTVEFVRLCDAAIVEAERVRDSMDDDDLRECANRVLDFLSHLRQRATDGTLAPSEGLGWGMTRFVGEWGEDTPLWDAVYALETFYRERMR